MKHYIYLAISALLMLTNTATAAERVLEIVEQQDSSLQALAERARRFGEVIPQEKVYVHMDNTCYFLGDTIWYKAYTRQTNNGKPSTVSRLLYVELLNQDGYLVERQIVDVKDGEGCGQFVLGDTAMYAGYYELRAYTRWQLNWGEYQHWHKPRSEWWFFNDTMAREFFRDYEKLYSRVFAVYDRPAKAGYYAKDMTLRPLLRYYSSVTDPAEPRLTLYPEGGHLVAGVPCRVAFEAAMSNGEVLEGNLTIEGTDIAAETVNRGRGVFTIVAKEGKDYKAILTTEDGKNVKVKLPRAEADGVALGVVHDATNWLISLHPKGTAATQPLGVTIMHEGVTEHTAFINAGDTAYYISLKYDSLAMGVHQVTVFDADGRIYADRLFFVNNSNIAAPMVKVEGQKEQYSPFEQATLDVYAEAGDTTTTISIAVRDGIFDDDTYDNGNIQTEMLLASEIRGFVPNPQWYFAANDEEHRHALDLLMMTQGWRRFNWRDMAVQGMFELVHPAEHRQVLTGAVHNYDAVQRENKLQELVNMTHYSFMGLYENLPTISMQINAQFDDIANEKGLPNSDGSRRKRQKAHDHTARMDSIPNLDANMKARMAMDGDKLKHEVLVHAEFISPQGNQSVVGEVPTEEGRFTIQLPRFYDACLFHIGAADTTKWSKRKKRKLQNHQYIWVLPEEDYPDYYIRLSFPYPRFVKPYDFYHMAKPTLASYESDILSADSTAPASQLRTELSQRSRLGGTLPQVNVNSRSRGKRNFKYARPVMKLDAYDAFNAVCDAGLIDGWYGGRSTFSYALMRWLVSDMGIYEYGVPSEIGYNVMPDIRMDRVSKEMPDSEINRYDFLHNLKYVELFTDYSPRLEGSNRYMGTNYPEFTVSFSTFADHSRRNSYRDRFIYLQGINPPAEFYSPDYSRIKPDTPPTDYRRTLYWNPSLRLDANGHARVQFYTGTRPATIAVDAQGQTANGTLLHN